MIELEDSHGSHGANITIGILETRAQRANEILEEIFDAQGTQTAQGETADHRVVIVAVLLEEIDGEKSKIGMAASVIANVEVAHFFEDEIGSSGAHDHFGEEGGHIDADGHVGYDFFVKLALNLFHAWLPAAGQLAQLRLEVDELAFAIIGIHGGGEAGQDRIGQERDRRKEKGRTGTLRRNKRSRIGTDDANCEEEEKTTEGPKRQRQRQSARPRPRPTPTPTRSKARASARARAGAQQE